MIHPNVKNHWYAILRSKKLKRSPVSRVLFGEPVVVFRSDKGVHALLDRCPHRHFPLSKGRIKNNQLQCHYHGWKFDTSGGCVSIPGIQSNQPKCSVPSLACVEQDGIIWVCFKSDYLEAPPDLKIQAIKGATEAWTEFTVDGSLFDAIENFVDPMHTHTVHAGLIRSGEKKRKPVRIQIKCEEQEVSASYHGEGAASGLIQRCFGMGITWTLGRFRLPSIVEMEYWNDSFLRCRIALLFTPTVEGQIHIIAGIFGRHLLAPLILPLLKPMLRMAIRQDSKVLSTKFAHESKYFEKKNYLFTEGDLLGPYIWRWLRHGKLEGTDRDVEVLL